MSVYLADGPLCTDIASEVKEPRGRIARWIERLSIYQFKIEHRPGRVHNNADTLSRLIRSKEEEGIAEVFQVNNEQWTPSKWNEATYLVVLAHLRHGPKNRQLDDALRRRGSRLAKKCLIYEDGSIRLRKTSHILPKPCEVQELIDKYHGLAHFGVKKTFHAIQADYRWPGMFIDIRQRINACKACKARKPAQAREPLHPVSVPGPFGRIGIDFVGPLPTTDKANRYIIVAIDYLTKWVEARATIDDTAQMTARFLYEEVICRHGCPSIIQSDRGTHFVNETIRKLTDHFGIRHKLSTPYHPQSNGLVERFNRTMKGALKRLVIKHESDWDVHLIELLFKPRRIEVPSFLPMVEKRATHSEIYYWKLSTTMRYRKPFPSEPIN